MMFVFENFFPEMFPLGFFFPNKPSRHCDEQSPVTFTLKVNETSTGTSDLFQTDSFSLFDFDQFRTEKHILNKGWD